MRERRTEAYGRVRDTEEQVHDESRSVVARRPIDGGDLGRTVSALGSHGLPAPKADPRGSDKDEEDD